MRTRAFGVWLLIVLVAVMNGGLREAWITPRTGAAVSQVADDTAAQST